MKTVIVTDIVWDLDDEDQDSRLATEDEIDIPRTFKMKIDDDLGCDYEDIIADKLSDEFGFCVKSFSWREAKR